MLKQLSLILLALLALAALLLALAWREPARMAGREAALRATRSVRAAASTISCSWAARARNTGGLLRYCRRLAGHETPDAPFPLPHR